MNFLELHQEANRQINYTSNKFEKELCKGWLLSLHICIATEVNSHPIASAWLRKDNSISCARFKIYSDNVQLVSKGQYSLDTVKWLKEKIEIALLEAEPEPRCMPFFNV